MKFFKLIKNSFMFSIKTTFKPHRYFDRVLKKPFLIPLMGILFVQLIISMIFIMSIDVLSTDVKNKDELIDFVNLFYSGLLLMPLVIALPAMLFNWMAQLLGGNGKFLKYYSLVIWSMLPSTIVIFLFGFLVGIINIFTEISSEMLNILMFIQFIPMVAYQIIAIKTAHSFSYVRACIAFSIGVGIMFIPGVIMK